MSNNAWTNSGAGPRQPPSSQSNAVASQGSAVPRFNAQEVRDYLKNGIDLEQLYSEPTLTYISLQDWGRNVCTLQSSWRPCEQ